MSRIKLEEIEDIVSGGTISVKDLVELPDRVQSLEQGGGGGGGGSSSVPVEWIEGVGEAVPLTDLSPNTMYILDVRSGNWLDVYIPENHSDIPVGAEYHFVCAGDPENVHIYENQPAPEEPV